MSCSKRGKVRRALAPALILALLVPLSSSLSARNPKPQERLHPFRPAFRRDSELPPRWMDPGGLGPQWARAYQYFFGFPERGAVDIGYCVGVLPRADGGIVVAATISHDSADYQGYRSNILVLGLDPSGTGEWQMFYEADPNLQCWNEAAAMIRTRQGDYLLVGSSGVDDVSPTDALVMKLNSGGVVLWIKTYHITSPNEGSWVEADTVVETQDGGYLVAGRGVVSGVWLMKLDANGKVLWHKELDNGNWIPDCALRATADGGSVLTGLSGGGGVELFKLDGNAVVQWHKSYVSDRGDTYGGGVTVLRDGGYTLGGATSHACSGEHSCFVGGWICRLNESGDIMWQRGYAESVPGATLETADRGLFIIDNRLSAILMLNSSGDLQWMRYVSMEECGLGIVPGYQDDDGCFMMGYSATYYDSNDAQVSQIGVMRLSPSGRIGTACSLIADADAPRMNPLIRVISGADLFVSDNSVQVHSKGYTPSARFFMGKIVCGPPINRKPTSSGHRMPHIEKPTDHDHERQGSRV